MPGRFHVTNYFRALFCVAAFSCHPALAISADDPDLLSDVAGTREIKAPRKDVKRRKAIHVRSDWRDRIEQGSEQLSLALPLFGNKRSLFRLKRRQSRQNVSLAYAEIPGVPGSAAYFAVYGTTMFGEIVLGPGERYQIRSDGQGGHWLDELDAADSFGQAEQGMAPPIAPLLSGQGFISEPMRAYCAASAPVDLLVVYDDKALVDSGSLAALNAQVEAEVFFTNMAYAKSGVNFSVRLLAVLPVSYAETSSATDLYRLQNPADGYLDQVPVWRDSYGADIVMMWVGSGAPYGGVAYQTDPSFNGPPYAYGLVSVVGTLRTLPHEMGHVMGLAHAYPDNPAFRYYGRGYPIPFAGGTLGTIMGGGPVGLDQFSNPSIFYDGVATGRAAGPIDAADEVSALNQAYPYVSAFRPTAVSGAAPLVSLTNPLGPGSYTAMDAITLSASASDSDGSVASVQFRIDNTVVGLRTSPPYSAYLDKLPAGQHFIFVSAIDNSGLRSDPCPVTIQVQPLLPAPWQEVFLSHPWNWESQASPAAGLLGGQYHLYGNGEMGGYADYEYMVYQPLCGDGEISARVFSQGGNSDWAVAALTMRKSAAAQSPFVQVSVARNGVYQRLQRDLDAGYVNNSGYATAGAARWLRLTRAGNTFTPYYSSDGSVWIQGPTPPSVIVMPGTILMGMAVTNPDLAFNNHVVFDNLNIVQSCPPPTPTCTASPSFTVSPTPSISPTATLSGTPSPTATITPTATQSPDFSATRSPGFAMSGRGTALLAPIPAEDGQPVCLYFPKEPGSSTVRLYNLAGELVGASTFGPGQPACVPTLNLRRGIYFAKLWIQYADGTFETGTRKIAVLKKIWH
jgi:hypothetical protein